MYLIRHKKVGPLQHAPRDLTRSQLDMPHRIFLLQLIREITREMGDK